MACTFLRRYKRFLVDVELDDGEQITVHTSNTGALKGCLAPGARAGIAYSDNPNRKLPATWMTIRLGRYWVGVHPPLANALAAELVGTARGSRIAPELQGYARCLPEIALESGSRIDFVLAKRPAAPGTRPRILVGDEPRRLLEVKSTTLVRKRGRRRIAAFPDAVSERGRKHLEELIAARRQGHEAAMLYIAQRNDCDAFEPAEDIDPAYAEAFRRARAAGVDMIAVACTSSPSGITVGRRLPLVSQ